MIRYRIYLIITVILIPLFALSQFPFTANDSIVDYNEPFKPGINFGAYQAITDDQLATLAAGDESIGVPGIGIKTARPGLFEYFVEEYGYDSRITTYQKYTQLGLTDNTVIVGFPSDAHRSTTYYCPDEPSRLFANMYEDIWDGGANGTPVNDDNYYALYLYKLVTLYKDHVKFWEIWNEPGFDYTGATGWLPPGAPGNWWENNPNPCDYKLKAPIFHYIRLLRISYEVIKSIDPTAHIVVSGTGYMSFLDAILRNTDNPVDGSPTTDYPLKGGAYFDVMGYHSYPHFDGSLRSWSNEINDWEYHRHSDAAIQGIETVQDTMQGVLNNYGYDGNTHPKKLWIITECNLPRKQYEDYIGSAEAQRNFIIKSFVQAEKDHILAIHYYKIAEDTEFDQSYREFDLMGFYKRLNYNDNFDQRVNEEGIAMRTATAMLYGKIYDPDETAALNLPSNVDGGAFRDELGNYTYVLWAKTTIDQSETANALYSFPAGINFNGLRRAEWDYTVSHELANSTSQNIALTGTPSFFFDAICSASPSVGCTGSIVQFNKTALTEFTHQSWTFEGGVPATSSAANPVVTFAQAGTHKVTLTVKDDNNQDAGSQVFDFVVESSPVADFTCQIDGPMAKLKSVKLVNADDYHWDFGDGTGSDDRPNPLQVYYADGTYTISLSAHNECGTANHSQTVDIDVPADNTLPFSANDQVATQNDVFRPGANFQYSPLWDDRQIGDIAGGNIALDIPGAGVKSFRSFLGEYFLKAWGYDIRFDVFQHFANLDIKDNTLTLGFPSIDSHDTTRYCPKYNSTVFKNMYLDIWDDGENGTPINENNYYATYVYHIVNTYKNFVKYWEVYNAPDYDDTGRYGWLPPGKLDNWWENNPDPCNCGLRAPITHYIRLLRISYEVVKTLDPDAYVTLPGLAYPSYLDAILRNTDNPAGGSIAPGYSLKGGAYFDAIGVKSFPHFDGTTVYYDQDLGEMVFSRNSDTAAKGIAKNKHNLETVLFDHGYDGATYPKKEWILNETNYPRKALGGFHGSDIAQKNWITKAYIEAIKEDIRQMDIYNIYERTTWGNAAGSLDMMGLYRNLDNVSPYNQVLNNEGIAYKTTSDLLYHTHFSQSRTTALNLPDGVDGAAFKDANNHYIYALWAKTTIDEAETANAEYSFPGAIFPSGGQLYRVEWDFSQTDSYQTVTSPAVELTGTPVFFLENINRISPPIALFEADNTLACLGEPVHFQNLSTDNATSFSWTFEGGTPAVSTDENPTVIYNQSGNHKVSLTVSNAAGSHTTTFWEYIQVPAVPTADFSYVQEGNEISFTNLSEGATGYFWTFGTDHPGSHGVNPVFQYYANGDYTVRLIAENECEADTIVRVISIHLAPSANYTWTTATCEPPYEYHFIDLSLFGAEEWTWTIAGGTPSTSNQSSPFVTFNESGTFDVTLEVSNEYGSTSITKTILVDGTAQHFITEDKCEGDFIIVNGVTYDQDNPAGQETITGGSASGCDSVIYVDLTFHPNEEVFLTEEISQGESFTVGDQTFSETGTYDIPLQSTFGCDSLVHLDLTVVVGIRDAQEEVDAVKCFPNPFRQSLTIELDLEKSSTVTIWIADILGRRQKVFLDHKTLRNGNHQLKRSLYGFPSGIYLVKIQIDDKVIIKRIVKE